MNLENEFSLGELLKYGGLNPKPEDFDSFWCEGLIEVNEIDPEVEILPAGFELPYCDCFHLYFTGTKNARIYAKLLRPKNLQNIGPGLLMFHGYSGNSGGWSEKPSKLAYVAAGFTVLAMDCRGQGGESLDGGNRLGWSLRGHIVRGLKDDPKNLYYRDVFLDTVQLVRIMKSFDFVDGNRIGVTGESQGGALALACASLFPEIKKVAPIFPFLCDYQRAWQFDTPDNAYYEIREYLRRFHPQNLNIEQVFRMLGYIDVQHLVDRISGDVLMATGLMDTRCPPSTQFAAFNKIVSEKKLEIYPNYGHERLPGHDDRILQFMLGLL